MILKRAFDTMIKGGLMHLHDVIEATEEQLLCLIDPHNNGYYAHRFSGCSSVCLVAHVDTYPRNYQIDLSVQDNCLYNRNGLLGADDRAGVFLILELLAQGVDLNVLLCNGEESGAIGARKAWDELDFSGIKFFIELDFRGNGEYAVYYPQPDWVHEIPRTLNFTEAVGTFTDIAVFHSIPGINISVGYRNQHTNSEYLELGSMLHTLKKLPELIRQAERKVACFSKEDISRQMEEA
jgi:di/tripeptidase